MNHCTRVDTISIQVDEYDFEKYILVLDSIQSLFKRTQGVFVQYEAPAGNISFRQTTVYHNRKILATLQSGASGTIVNGYAMTLYYIVIKFAGIASYNAFSDKTSMSILMRLFAYLNTRGIGYKFTELDICIDVYAPFSDVLALCTKKSPKTKYHQPGAPQVYATTRYVEDIRLDKTHSAVLRSYLYDKRLKEGLSFNVTRFEIKLQHAFFSKYGYDLQKINKTLHRYYVLYVPDPITRKNLIAQYNSYTALRNRDVEKMKLKQFRLEPNMMRIDDLIVLMQMTTESDLYSGSFRIPEA